MSKSSIEWTQETWNPIVGCSILSPGCIHCYAMGMAARIEAMNQGAADQAKPVPAPQYAGTTKKVNGNTVWTGKLAMAGDNILLQPLKRKKPTTYFVNSMGDLFHEDVPDAWIDRVFAVMALTPWHTYQVLTKRAKRMREYLTRPAVGGKQDARNRLAWVSTAEMMDRWFPNWKSENVDEVHRARAIAAFTNWPLPNVWLGVSTERQQDADERIPELLQTPAAVRFISAEPLLGPIDLKRWMPAGRWGKRVGTGEPVFVSKYFMTRCEHCGWHGSSELCHLSQNADDADVVCPTCNKIFLCDDFGGQLDWVIVGGESGADARPMHPDWARSLRVQCEAAGVPFFFKQWGSFVPIIDRDNDDPDWRRDYQRASTDPDQFKILNLAGGCGFHGERVHLMQRYSKAHAGRSLDGIEYSEMPACHAEDHP